MDGWPVHEPGAWHDMLTCDTNGDGLKEIVTFSSMGMVFFRNHHGELVNWINLARNLPMSVIGFYGALGDMNNDGDMELACMDFFGSLFIYDANGQKNPVFDWSQNDISAQRDRKAPVYKKGDLNFDGFLGFEDLSLLYQHLYHQTLLIPMQQRVADVNKDGSIDSTDEALLREMILNPPVYQKPAFQLLNPGFENALRSWENPSHPFTVSSEAFHGMYCARDIIEEGFYGNYWNPLYQEFSAEPGVTLAGGAYVKTNMNPDSTARAGVLLQFFDEEGEAIPESEIKREIGGYSEWQILGIGGVTPEGTALVRFSVFVWGAENDPEVIGAEAFFDDCFLTEISSKK